jgi:hypothetical protein
MSTTSSIGTYDSLFDDDGGALSGICFDLDSRQVVSCDDRISNTWCIAHSSCCSLCRPRVVSEAVDDLHGSTFVNGCESSGDEVGFKSTSYTSCNSKMPSCDHDSASDPYGLTIKSITIPRSPHCFATDCCIDPKPTALPVDALRHMFQFLDISSLCHVRACNTELRSAVSKDNPGWTEQCKRLWSQKANVCSTARDLLTRSNIINTEETSNETCAAMEAYTLAIHDATTRNEISMEELCFDEASNHNASAVWSFRFKESAGHDWTSWDPWWNGQDARKLVFLRDGTVLQAYPQGSEHCVTTLNGTQLFNVFSERNVQRDGPEVPSPRIEMKWRFVSHSLDLPIRPNGSYVRITVGGRDVPTYVVRRSHNGNWGFILESCWGMYASYEMARQVMPSSIFGNGRRSIRRTRNGGWVDVAESDDEDDREISRDRMRNVRRRIALFEEESTMTQNAHSQWREALLYNIGAVVLPEGPGSEMIDFQNAWRNAMVRL